MCEQLAKEFRKTAQIKYPRSAKTATFNQEASPRKTDRISVSIFAFFGVETERHASEEWFDGSVSEYQLFWAVRMNVWKLGDGRPSRMC